MTDRQTNRTDSKGGRRRCNWEGLMKEWKVSMIKINCAKFSTINKMLVLIKRNEMHLVHRHGDLR